jgi:hypothetical protein
MVELKALDDAIFDLYCRLGSVADHEKELFISSGRNVRKALGEIGELRVRVRSVKRAQIEPFYFAR